MKEIVSDGTIWGSHEWYKARWNSVPEEMKEKILTHLRKLDNLDQVKKALEEDPGFHFFGGGMWVRNYLREVVRDSELPDAPYPHNLMLKNWDDFYQQAIRAA